MSKNCSTFAAEFVSKPKSIKSAANDITPSGTFIAPDIIPAVAAVSPDILLLSSASDSKDSSVSLDFFSGCEIVEGFFSNSSFISKVVFSFTFV